MNKILMQMILHIKKLTAAIPLFISFAIFLVSCDQKMENKLSITQKPFGESQNGENVDLYQLKNNSGMTVEVITYGGIITALHVPNREGVIEDVVLGYTTLADYEKSSPYFGALVGRYGNRIANGQFDLEGETYTLAQNDGKNHLHGGNVGFDKVVWSAETKISSEEVALILRYVSPDGEEGYPGTLSVEVAYRLTENNTLIVDYLANTDKSTVVNLTQHSYFNLSANFESPILDHEVQLFADHYLPVDATLIPTGEIAPVEQTPFDFTEPKPIGKEIEMENEQLQRGGGYDHCWVLNSNKRNALAARVYHPSSGRVLQIYTDEPAIQFYTGNFLDGTLPNKKGGVYNHRSGFCLETQHYPDSPNQTNFPTVVLRPNETYRTSTKFEFLTSEL